MDLAAQTAAVDGLLSVTTVGLKNATATGCKVRMKGDAGDNTLDAYGHDVVIKGAGGGDRMGRVGNGFDVDLPACGRSSRCSRARAAATISTGGSATTSASAVPGRDAANGAGGIDVCRTEVRQAASGDARCQRTSD